MGTLKIDEDPEVGRHRGGKMDVEGPTRREVKMGPV